MEGLLPVVDSLIRDVRHGIRALLRLNVPDNPSLVPTGAAVTSPIFRTGVAYLMPLLLLFAIFLMLRGHNEPGGGFVGGLVAAGLEPRGRRAYGRGRGLHRRGRRRRPNDFA